MQKEFYFGVSFYSFNWLVTDYYHIDNKQLELQESLLPALLRVKMQTGFLVSLAVTDQAIKTDLP